MVLNWCRGPIRAGMHMLDICSQIPGVRVYAAEPLGM